jgi:hypothetical protein
VLHDYQNQHSYELKWNNGEVCWKGKLNSLKEMRMGLIHGTSVAPVVTMQHNSQTLLYSKGPTGLVVSVYLLIYMHTSGFLSVVIFDLHIILLSCMYPRLEWLSGTSADSRGPVLVAGLSLNK